MVAVAVLADERHLVSGCDLVEEVVALEVIGHALDVGEVAPTFGITVGFDRVLGHGHNDVSILVGGKAGQIGGWCDGQAGDCSQVGAFVV